MNQFEFLFSFYGLLLGLALSTVALGFARLWRVKDKTPVGGITLIIAAYLVLLIMSLWLGAWDYLQGTTVNAFALILTLMITLPLIFVSAMLFPEDAADWPSLDAYYLAHSRVIVLALVISSVASLAAPVIADTAFPLASLPGYLIRFGPEVLALLALALTRRRGVHYAVFGVIVAWNLFGMGSALLAAPS